MTYTVSSGTLNPTLLLLWSLGATVMQNWPFSSIAVAAAIAITHYAYPRWDGQAVLAWVTGLNNTIIYSSKVTHPSTNWDQCVTTKTNCHRKPTGDLVIYLVEGCYYFLLLPSRLHSIIVLWPVANYTVWWQRHRGVNNLHRVVRWQE